MKLSRKAKRYDDSVLPGEFQGFETFHQTDVELDGTLDGFLRREVDGVQLGEMILERHVPKKLSFAKLKTKAEKLSEQVNYLKERLEIVDHDRRGMYIQLRSLPPYVDRRNKGVKRRHQEHEEHDPDETRELFEGGGRQGG